MKYVKCVDSCGRPEELTEGKVYEVVGEPENDGFNSVFEIANDAGVVQKYARNRFQDVTEAPCKTRNAFPRKGDEIDKHLASRFNGMYRLIKEDAQSIMSILGPSDEFTYYYSQIASMLAHMKHGHRVEASLADIAGYSRLELKQYREINDGN